MRLLTLTLTLLLTANLISAQNLFTVEGANWKEVSCGHWSNLVGLYSVEKLRIEGDTIFNGVQYKKLYRTFEEYKYSSLTNQDTDSLFSSTDAFFGGIREDSQKIYVAASSFDITMEEKLIFDFSAHVNDTIQIWFETMGYYPVIVDSIYSVTVADGSSRNKFTLKEYSTGNPSTNFWIEGIGSYYGFLSSHYEYISDVSKILRCAKGNDEITYDFEPSSYFYCSVYPVQDCANTVTGTTKVEDPLDVKIYPNPMIEHAILKFHNPSNSIFSIDIYDLRGVRMNAGTRITKDEVIIERRNLSSGLYIVRLYSNNEIAYTGKLLVE